jgi:hypothetical protein
VHFDRRLEALRRSHLDDITRGDVIPGARHHQPQRFCTSTYLLVAATLAVKGRLTSSLVRTATVPA